jgi:hypothetical protein
MMFKIFRCLILYKIMIVIEEYMLIKQDKFLLKNLESKRKSKNRKILMEWYKYRKT